jgi:hypothetical protein
MSTIDQSVVHQRLLSALVVDSKRDWKWSSTLVHRDIVVFCNSTIRMTAIALAPWHDIDHSRAREAVPPDLESYLDREIRKANECIGVFVKLKSQLLKCIWKVVED